MGLRVVSVDGTSERFQQAFLRATVGLVDFFLIPIGFVAVVSALLSPRDQRLGDMAAGTIVVRERSARRRRRPGAGSGRRSGCERYAASLDVTALDEDELRGRPHVPAAGRRPRRRRARPPGGAHRQPGGRAHRHTRRRACTRTPSSVRGAACQHAPRARRRRRSGTAGAPPATAVRRPARRACPCAGTASARRRRPPPHRRTTAAPVATRRRPASAATVGARAGRLPRPRGHHAAAARGASTRCCRGWASASATRRAPTAVARAARQAVDEARDAVAAVARLPARRGRLHRRRHRGRQPGRRRGPRRPARPGAVQRRRAPRRARARCAAAGGRTRPGRRRRASSTSTRSPRLLDARHDAGVGDARQQRGRHRPAAGRGRRAWCAGGRPAPPSTPTPCRPRRGSTARRRLAGADLVAVSAHKFGGPRASARSSSGAGTPLRPARRWAAARSASGAAAPTTSPASSGSPRPLPRPSAPPARRPRRGSRARATAWPTGCWPPVAGAGRDRAAGRDRRLPGTLHVCRAGRRERGAAVPARRGRACARRPASACASGAQQPSHVLAAMGVPAEPARRARCGCRSAGRRPTPTSTGRSRSCPAAVARLRERVAA